MPRSRSTAPVVVITGASSGIARATALEYAAHGARLVLASRRDAALQEVVAECEALGAEAIAVVTDVSENGQVERLATTAVARFGRIDVWVNAASVAVYGRLTDVPLDDLRRTLDVNVLGYVYGCRAALRQMVEQGEGAVVNIASVIGEVPQAYNSAYSMAKAAVRALTGSLRQELALDGHRRITVSSVLPPTVDTPFFRHAANYSGRELRAMPPVYAPRQVAKAVLRAARTGAPEIAVGSAAKAFVREHRRHPIAAEAQMAMQTDTLQLSRRSPADASAGNLYRPAPLDDAAVVGGYDGDRRTTVRRLVGATLALGTALLAVTRIARMRSGQGASHPS